jgi:hypothetical protein
MSTDRLLAFISLVLGLAGLFAAYIFYKKSLRLKLPTYTVYTNNLVQNAVSQMSGLEIAYKSHRVSALSVSKIVFWNAGSETLDSSDIVTANPLRVCCEGDVQLLDAEVLLANNKSSQLTVEVANSGNEAFIGFGYLDKNQGGVIQVVHTGLVSTDLAIRGDFKGAKISAINTTKPASKLVVETSVMLRILLVALIVIGYFFSSKFITFAHEGVNLRSIFAGLSGGVAGFLVNYDARSPDSRIPMGLRDFR